jgi:hypothetical protein
LYNYERYVFKESREQIFMISLAEYLDREECRERPEKECLRLVIDLHGETVADNINWLMKHAPESSELYDALSLPLGVQKNSRVCTKKDKQLSSQRCSFSHCRLRM